VIVVTTDASPRVPTDAEALTELEHLLVKRLKDALIADAPPASALAVAERFLSARKWKKGPAPRVMDPNDVPFPKQLEPDYPTATATKAPSTPPKPGSVSLKVPFPRAEVLPRSSDAPTMAEALQKPFVTDSDTAT